MDLHRRQHCESYVATFIGTNVSEVGIIIISKQGSVPRPPCPQVVMPPFSLVLTHPPWHDVPLAQGQGATVLEAS